MTRTSVSEAGENLQAIIDQASRNNDPVLITGNGFNAVLLGEEVWIGIQETLSLLSISGMRQSILAVWPPRSRNADRNSAGKAPCLG